MFNNPLTLILRIGLLGFVVVLASSCAPSAPLKLKDEKIRQVWPAPPEAARIELLRAFEGSVSLSDKDTQKGRLYRWLTGDMAEQTPLVSPYGVATDGQGLIWITDPGAHAVHSCSLTSRRTVLWTLAGNEPLQGPSGITYDPVRQRVYVADSAARKVYSFTGSGEFIAEIKGEAPLGRPGGLAVDRQGVLYVADVLAGLVRRFSKDGLELPSFGSPTTPDGRFNRPTAVAVDAEGLVYVVDSLNFRVEVLSAKGEAVSVIGKLGDYPGSFSRPRGVAVDSHGHIYVSDAAFDNVQIFNRDGQLLLVFGNGGKYSLSLPAGMQSDEQDRIYVVDSFNHRVMIYRFLGSAN